MTTEAEVMTTDQIAAHYQRTPCRIRQIADSRGIVPLIVVGRVKVWSARDLDKFTPGPTGRRREKKEKAQ